MADETPTFRSLVVAFTDFLTVAIHTILFERQIYPLTSFISARKYNFAVRQNRHPKVCEWINDAVAAVESELLKSAVDRVAVVIFTKHNKPLERFVFDVSSLPIVPTTDVDLPLQRTSADGPHVDILPLVDLEEQLRATLSRFSYSTSTLGPPSKDCTFTVVVELRSGNNAPMSHPQPWVPAERQTTRDKPVSREESQITPIRAVRAGDMIFESWVEQIQDHTASHTSESSSTG